MLRRVALVRTDVTEERIASIIRVTRIGELGTSATSNRRTLRRYKNKQITANDVPSSPILFTLMMEAIRFSDTSSPIRATQRNIQEEGIPPTCSSYT
jgi:hypothetical protein